MGESGFMQKKIGDIVGQFAVNGAFVAATEYGNGHINSTYRVKCQRETGVRHARYILQRINTHIFKNVPALMSNINRCTSHIRQRMAAQGVSDPERRVPTVVPTCTGGGGYLEDAEGVCWRMYICIEDASSCDVVETPRQAFEAARAFGRFQMALADLPGDRLHETIPDFHHTRKRFDALMESVRRDVCGRAASVASEIRFATERESMVDRLLDLQAAGRLPERVTHNDTKLNNVLLDHATGEGICVVDLDTLMPGLALYDFGDMVRTATATGAEDERDLSLVSSNMVMFEALLGGYLEATGDMLTDEEASQLVFSGQLITLEVGMRFLTDFLSGDTYFKVHREGHNLDRCRTQFRMVESLEAQASAMQRLVDRCWK